MTDLKTDKFIDLKKFISDFCGISVNKIAADSKLESDLRLYGDDTVELILAYSKKYNVDISQFQGKNFIAPEGDTVLPFIANMFTKSKKKRMDITVLNLLDGITAGRLDGTVIGA